MQVVAEDASRTAPRSGLLDRKNNSCNIPVEKRAEFRLMETFGELPEMTKEEVAENKMKAYHRGPQFGGHGRNGEDGLCQNGFFRRPG